MRVNVVSAVEARQMGLSSKQLLAAAEWNMNNAKLFKAYADDEPEGSISHDNYMWDAKRHHEQAWLLSQVAAQLAPKKRSKRNV